MEFNYIDIDFYDGFHIDGLDIVSFVNVKNTTNESVLVHKEKDGILYCPIQYTFNSVEDARTLYKAISYINKERGKRSELFFTGNDLFNMGITLESPIKDQIELNKYFYDLFAPISPYFLNAEKSNSADNIICDGINVSMASGASMAIAIAALSHNLNVNLYLSDKLILNNIFGDSIQYEENEIREIFNDYIDRLTNENYFIDGINKAESLFLKQL